ncbi:MAG: BlaI/MecI/CopY family transcriptional regulator [Acidobacteria bacterium]|nr:BlaI/MecI/CopY family transcriptional regulator [Acidobacteriota bacterium]
MAARHTLTPLELEIMKIVWDRRSATVRDVYEALRKRRKIAYTTVLTMMKILEQKKHLKRNDGERAHVYQPVRGKRQVVGAMVKDFVSRVFDGAAEPLLVHLVRDQHLSEEDLERVARMIREGE